MIRLDKRIRDFDISNRGEREIRFHAAASLNLTNRFGLRNGARTRPIYFPLKRMKE